jgi:hypothetical protein
LDSKFEFEVKIENRKEKREIPCLGQNSPLWPNSIPFPLAQRTQQLSRTSPFLQCSHRQAGPAACLCCSASLSRASGLALAACGTQWSAFLPISYARAASNEWTCACKFSFSASQQAQRFGWLQVSCLRLLRITTRSPQSP